MLPASSNDSFGIARVSPLNDSAGGDAPNGSDADDEDDDPNMLSLSRLNGLFALEGTGVNPGDDLRDDGSDGVSVHGDAAGAGGGVGGVSDIAGLGAVGALLLRDCSISSSTL